MPGEIRKLSDLGNGSGGMVIPKDTLRSWGLVDNVDSSVDTHLLVTQSDEEIRVKPISMSAGGSD